MPQGHKKLDLDRLKTEHRYFFEHLLVHFGVNSSSDEDLNALKEPYKTWLNWGLGGFERAEQTFDKISQYRDLSSCLRHLDIGCGPGYLSTVFALNGFESIGLDSDRVAMAQANANKKDFPDKNLQFIEMDCMADELLTLGKFDVITVDNVIEHVESPSLLLSRLKNVLRKDGIIYIVAPNARSINLVKSDPHYNLFGLSLLDKTHGRSLLNALTEIDFYDVNSSFFKDDMAIYCDRFEKHNFRYCICDDSTNAIKRVAFLNIDIEVLRDDLYAELGAMKVKLPESLFCKLENAVVDYMKEIEKEFNLLKDDNSRFQINLDKFYYKFLASSYFFILTHAACPVSLCETHKRSLFRGLKDLFRPKTSVF